MKRGERLENAPRVRRKDDLSPPHPIRGAGVHIRAQSAPYAQGVALLCRAKLLYFTEDLLSLSLMCSLFMRGKTSSVIQYGSNEGGNKKRAM